MWVAQIIQHLLMNYRKTSNISRTLVGNKIVDHSNAGPTVSFEEKKGFLKRLISFKKRFSSLRIKPLKYADRLKGTPCDQRL